METDDSLNSKSVHVFADEREAFQKIVIDNWKGFPKDKRKKLAKYKYQFATKDRRHISNEKLLSVLEEFFGVVVEKKIIIKI